MENRMMSEQISELVKALVRFQNSMNPIEKTKQAKIKTKSGVDYSYYYADFAVIMEAVKKPLVENGLAITQCFNGDALVTTLWHISGQWISSFMNCSGVDQEIRQEGSEITYRRRYALTAILGISTEEDDDGAAANGREEPAKKPAWNPKIVSPEAEEPINKMEALKEAVEKSGMPSKHLMECISSIATERKETFNKVVLSIFYKVNGINRIEEFKKAYRTFLDGKGALAV